LAIGFFVTTWGARFAAGWVVGSGVAEYEQKETALGRGSRLLSGKKEARMRKWGTMIISGLSGERLSVSGGLLRFSKLIFVRRRKLTRSHPWIKGYTVSFAVLHCSGLDCSRLASFRL